MKEILRKILEASLIGCYDPESLYEYHKLPYKELVKRAKQILEINMIEKPRVVKVEKIREILAIKNGKLDVEKLYAIFVRNPAPVFIDNPPPPQIVILVSERDLSKIFLGNYEGRVESIKPNENGGLNVKMRYRKETFYFNIEYEKIKEDLQQLLFEQKLKTFLKLD